MEKFENYETNPIFVTAEAAITAPRLNTEVFRRVQYAQGRAGGAVAVFDVADGDARRA